MFEKNPSFFQKIPFLDTSTLNNPDIHSYNKLSPKTKGIRTTNNHLSHLYLLIILFISCLTLIHATPTPPDVNIDYLFNPVGLTALSNVSVRISRETPDNSPNPDEARPIISNSGPNTIPLSSLSMNPVKLLSNIPHLTGDGQPMYLLGNFIDFEFFFEDNLINFSNLLPHNPHKTSHYTQTKIIIDNNEPVYAIDAIYSGSRIDNHGQVEDIILTLIPLSINDLKNDSNNALEAQDINNNNDTMDINYTISATIFRASGEVYQIETISTLIFTQTQQLESLLTQYNQHITTQDVKSGEFETQSTLLLRDIDIITDKIKELKIQQEENSKNNSDLAMYKLKTDPTPCQTQHPSNEDNINQSTSNDTDNTQSPLSMNPKFVFQKWESCHYQVHHTTIFTQRIYVSYSYAVWVSGSLIIDPVRIEARIRHIFALMNVPYYQQLGIFWEIESIIIRTTPTDEKWNVSALPSSEKDPRCTTSGAEQLLEDFAAVRSENISGTEWNASMHHLFIHCPPARGPFTNGIAYQDHMCTKTRAVAWTSFIDPLNYITLAHESGHVSLGLGHPFEKDKERTGQFGGIMDYVNQHLNYTTAETRSIGRIGFNKDTDYTVACTALKNLLESEYPDGDDEDLIEKQFCFKAVKFDDRTNGGTNGDQTNQSQNPSVRSPPIGKVYSNSPTCGNGIVEPWEECDVDTSCCIDCRLINKSTCDGSEPQCCTITPNGCYATASNDQKCHIGEFSAGFCWRGQCLGLQCVPEREPIEHDKCDADAYFNTVPTSPCVYSCPIIEEVDPTPEPEFSSLQGEPTYKCTPSNDGPLRLQWFQDGAYCYNPPPETHNNSNNNIIQPTGICLQTHDSNIHPKCTPFTEMTYSWKYSQFQQCECPKMTQIDGMYTCHDQSGLIVSSDFCLGLDKPPIIPTCNCSERYYWSYSNWSTTCGYTECDFGLMTRSYWCYYKETDLDGNLVEKRVPNEDCITAFGHDGSSQRVPQWYTECKSTLKCNSGWDCEANMDPKSQLEVWRKCVHTDNDQSGDELSTSEFVFAIIFFVLLFLLFIGLVLCICRKCHIPPFHGRDKDRRSRKKRGDVHIMDGVEAMPSYARYTDRDEP